MIQEIAEFLADSGGTLILQPLISAIKLKTKKKYKRIFLLTDGQVAPEERDQIINFAKTNNKIARVHTFGIGTDCDLNLIQETAIAGRGSCSFAANNDCLCE